MAIVSAILVITRRNPVHSALSLIVTLLALAGLYLMLYAPFVAGVQIMLYAGGIMVLFLFVIMLVNIERAQREEQFNKQWLVGIAGQPGAGRCCSCSCTSSAAARFSRRIRCSMPEPQNTQQVGMMLFRELPAAV